VTDGVDEMREMTKAEYARIRNRVLAAKGSPLRVVPLAHGIADFAIIGAPVIVSDFVLGNEGDAP
jgi:hypothetical protein